jgi:hypothetical protein
MIYLLDITGAFFYLVFRVLILPVLAVVGCFFAVLLLIKTIRNLNRRLRAIKLQPVQPLYRLARVRLNLSK